MRPAASGRGLAPSTPADRNANAPRSGGSAACALGGRNLTCRAGSGSGSNGRGGDKAIIDEVERGEDHLKSKYEEAMADKELSPQTLALIGQAYDSVRAGHDKVSAIKHSMKAREV